MARRVKQDSPSRIRLVLDDARAGVYRDRDEVCYVGVAVEVQVEDG